MTTQPSPARKVPETAEPLTQEEMLAAAKALTSVPHWNRHDNVRQAIQSAFDAVSRTRCNAYADMLAALLGLQVIAEQHVTDLAAEAQEGGPVARMELARWSAVGAAIAKAEGRS